MVIRRRLSLSLAALAMLPAPWLASPPSALPASHLAAFPAPVAAFPAPVAARRAPVSSCTTPPPPPLPAPPYLHLSAVSGVFGQQFTYTLDPRLSTTGWAGWELAWDGTVTYYTGGGAPVSGQSLYVPRSAGPGYHVVGLYRDVASPQGPLMRGPLAAAAPFFVPGPSLCPLPTPTPGPGVAGLRVVGVGGDIEAVGVDAARRHGIAITGPGAAGAVAILFDTRTLAVLARTPLRFVPQSDCCSVSVDERHGRILFAAGYSAVVLDTQTGAQVLATGAAGSAAGALAAGTGRAFVVGDDNGGTVLVFDDVSGRQVGTLSETAAEPAAIAVGDGARVLIGGRYPTALIDPRTRRRRLTMAVSVVDVRSHRVIATRAISGDAWTGAADAQGHAFLGVTGGVATFDLARGTQIGTTQGGGLAIALAVDEPLHRVFAAEAATMVTQGTSVSAIDSRTGAAVGSVDIGFRPLSLAVDPSLQRIVAVGYDAHLQQHAAIIDAARMRVRATRLVGDPGTQEVCNVGDPGCRPALVTVDRTLHQAYIVGADRKLYVASLRQP